MVGQVFMGEGISGNEAYSKGFGLRKNGFSSIL
jgi:hypothetical protein